MNRKVLIAVVAVTVLALLTALLVQYSQVGGQMQGTIPALRPYEQGGVPQWIKPKDSSSVEQGGVPQWLPWFNYSDSVKDPGVPQW